MTVLLIAAGLVLLVTITLDQFTIIAGTERGTGVFVHRMSSRIWRLALRAHRRWPSHRRLAVTGVFLLVLAPLTWILGLWIGWSAIFAASQNAVVDSQTAQPASLAGRIYHAGISLFTLGLGDLRPGSDPWRLATVCASMMGLTMVTLSVTYLVPVSRAATGRRILARQLRQFGLLGTGDLEYGSRESVHRTSATEVTTALTYMIEQFNELTEQHLNHPLLRYHHVVDDNHSLAVQLCATWSFLRDQRADDSIATTRLRSAVTELAVSMANPISESTRGPGRPAIDTDVNQLMTVVLSQDGRSDLAGRLGLRDARSSDEEPPGDGPADDGPAP